MPICVARSSEPVDPDKIADFKALAKAEYKRLSQPEPNFDELDQEVEDVNKAATVAAELRDKEEGTGEAEDKALDKELIAAEEKTAEERDDVFAILDHEISEARRREKLKAGERKFVAADRTAAVSQLGLMVGEGASDKEKAKIQDKIDGYSDRISQMTEELGAANTYRTALDGIRADIDGTRANLAKDRGTMETELGRLETQAPEHAAERLESSRRMGYALADSQRTLFRQRADRSDLVARFDNQFQLLTGGPLRSLQDMPSGYFHDRGGHGH